MLGVLVCVGVGYVVDEVVCQGGFLIFVIGVNLYVWFEFYIDGVGWVVVDVLFVQSMDVLLLLFDFDLQCLFGEMVCGFKLMVQFEDCLLELLIKIVCLFKVWLICGFGLGVLVSLIVLYLIKLWCCFVLLVSLQGFLWFVYCVELDWLVEILMWCSFGEICECFVDCMVMLLFLFVLLIQQYLVVKFV